MFPLLQKVLWRSRSSRSFSIPNLSNPTFNRYIYPQQRHLNSLNSFILPSRVNQPFSQFRYFSPEIVATQLLRLRIDEIELQVSSPKDQLSVPSTQFLTSSIGNNQQSVQD